MPYTYDIFVPYGVPVPLQVVSFTATPAVAEMGSTVSTVVLNWQFNRDVDTVVVAGQTLGGNRNVLSLSGALTADQSWALKGTTENYSASQKTALSFQNKAYWGVVTATPSDSATILSLPNLNFMTTKTKFRLAFTCTGSQRPVFCYPKRLGPISGVWVSEPVLAPRGTVKWVKFSDLTSTIVVNFTNSSGFSEDYYVCAFNSLPLQGYFEVQWTGQPPPAPENVMDPQNSY